LSDRAVWKTFIMETIMSDQPTTDNDTTTPSGSNYQPWPDHAVVIWRDTHDGEQRRCACGFTPKDQSDPVGAERLIRLHVRLQ
jgi:hypothetical protein